ncbi:hypothetical protein GSI_00526 [Ganoderma sinense ZZ0214-1]|uniref:MYND-type domain-containing protein n=1 Tax=Ganoderma sinense ZZ0214-1 TaxID=1077348 RepID=A0A2G8SST9_9APHY|nr:hypothetical protein GSI_00526 [Ganoderma sinense ZZ0214-1]
MIQAAPDFMEKHPRRKNFWSRTVRSDPGRAVRVLSLNGLNDETVEGDTGWDGVYVIEELQDLAREAKSQTWKGLVNAGVTVALCKCALNFQAAVMHKHTTQPNQKEADKVAKDMYSPYFIPFEIMSNAMATCAIPPTATEKRFAEDIKKHWSTVMQRVWSEPARSLEVEPKQTRFKERIVVPQVASRVVLIDPSFLDTIFKPADLTLPVVFRFWMHSSGLQDTRMALSLLSPIIDPSGPPENWKAHLTKKPAPPIKDLLPRLFLGASKTAGSNKKRTPGQTADAVVSASARHLDELDVGDLSWEYNFFHALFTHSKEVNRVFNRAVYKSAKFWAANVSVLRRAAKHNGPNREGIYMSALNTFTAMMDVVDNDGKDFMDALVYNWLSAGIFDALEETMQTCLNAPRGPMVLAGVITALDRYQPQCSAKTRKLFRSELPRPVLVKRLFVLSSFASVGTENTENDPAVMARKAAGIWMQRGWQTLAVLALRMADPDDCTRRTCENKRSAEAEEKGLFVCEKCSMVKYCSDECLTSDVPNHSHVCGWVHVARPGQPGPRAKSDAEPASIAASSQSDSPSPETPTISTSDEGPSKLVDLD